MALGLLGLLARTIEVEVEHRYGGPGGGRGSGAALRRLLGRPRRTVWPLRFDSIVLQLNRLHTRDMSGPGAMAEYKHAVGSLFASQIDVMGVQRATRW